MFLNLVVRDRGWVMEAQLVVETSAHALDGKNFFLDGDLRPDVVVASEDVRPLEVDAQMVDLVGEGLKVCQEQAPAKSTVSDVDVRRESHYNLTYQRSSSQSPKFVELMTILR